MSSPNRHISITEETRAKLLAHRERTGISTMRLLRGKKDTLPKGLNSALVNQWLKGAIRSARPEHLNFVLVEWGKLPDKSESMLQISEASKTHLRNKLKATGLSSIRNLFRGRNDLPEGFTEKSMRIAINPNPSMRNVNKAHYDYMLRVCDEYLDMKSKVKR